MRKKTIIGITYNMSYKQGDIVLLPFPFTDQKGSKKRPALVVSGSLMNNTADIMVVQITKETRNDNFSLSINATDLTKPLRYTSEIRCNKILVAEQRLICKKVSSVNKKLIDAVKKKINEIIDL